MGMKKFQLFLLGKKSTMSAYNCPPTWRIEGVFMTSTPVLSHRFPRISWNKFKNLTFFLTFVGKNVGMTDFDDRLSQRSKVVLRRLEQKKKYTKLVSLISLMLPRSRSFHLSGTIFVYGWTDSINIKIGKFKGQRRKVINLWWLSYIW